jgi:hypothetical protein
MKRISHLFSPVLIACSLFLTLALALSLGTAVHAAPSAGGSSPAVTLPPVTCLSAAPPSQQVAVGQTAVVIISVTCYPTSLLSYVNIAWGDGSSSRYPICMEVCHVPPIVIKAPHIYQLAGLYQPEICLVGLPSAGPAALCTSVKIAVVAPTPTLQS